MCSAKTFKNPKGGDFPIGFLIWDLKQKQKITKVQLDIFKQDGEFFDKKFFYANSQTKTINQWIKKFTDNQGFLLDEKQEPYAICTKGTDFQNNNFCNINFWSKIKGIGTAQGVTKFKITKNNLIFVCIYFSVRHAIKSTWLNNGDQFLYPNEKWQNDTEFQNDCLIFALFHEKNKITSKDGINHFIPFSESEVDAKEKFASDFMFKFLQGNHGIKPSKAAVNEGILFDKKELNAQNFIPIKALKFSPQAQAVLDAGRELWAYYHSQDFKNSQKPYNANASLYDIREYFQGVKMLANGKTEMNTPKQSKDEHYKTLYKALQDSLNALAAKITPKIYEYGFLME